MRRVLRLVGRVLVRLFLLIKANRLWIIIALLVYLIILVRPINNSSIGAMKQVQRTASWQETTAKDLGNAIWTIAVATGRVAQATEQNTARLDSVMKHRNMEPIFDGAPLFEGTQEAK